MNAELGRGEVHRPLDRKVIPSPGYGTYCQGERTEGISESEQI